MARKRVIYQSEALYASPTTSAADGCIGDHGFAAVGTAPKQVQRVQNANYSFSIERQDVNQFGELAAIDRVILSSPTVSLDFQYLLANFVNEVNLGFKMSTGGTWNSCITDILNKTKDEKCYYIRTVGEGLDAIGGIAGTTANPNTAGNADQGVIGIGNGYMTSYTTEGSIGNFPTVSINVEALNMKVYSGNPSGEFIPAVTAADGKAVDATNKNFKFVLPDALSDAGTDATHVLRPGDISFGFYKAADDGTDNGVWTNDSDFGGTDMAIADVALQSYNVSFDIGRTPLEKLGSRFAFTREIDFPVTITMSLEATVGDLKAGGLSSAIDTDQAYNLYVYLKDATTSHAVKAMYHLKRAKLDSQEFSSGIGDNKSVTLNFSAQVGGPGQDHVGFFMSGVSV